MRLPVRLTRLPVALLALGLLAPGIPPTRAAAQEALPASTRSALAQVRADSLRGHVSFLASDLLAGRATPSPGLDIAAEYIAAQFRRIGLRPAGNDGYFQTAEVTLRRARPPQGAEAGQPALARTLRLRNVAGLRRGSDPQLRDTFVLVSAHYDHLGARQAGEGDRIFNGANDDASGVASMLDVAAALTALPQPPKRSILFVTWSGEEKGLLGSRHYGDHPLVPIEKTVAMVNLEQTGRTDDSEGLQVDRFSVTGFDYSTVGETLRAAGARVGVTVVKHPRNSDEFFARSDNQALADQGVPAHTISVAYHFPDYHGVGDHWEKLDYPNMERVTRAVALAVLTLADDPREPRWSESVPLARPYLDAWKRRHP